jgi:hypothetical protein
VFDWQQQREIYFCRRPQEPGQTVKTRQSSPINFPEPREMGISLTRDPKYNL